MKKVFFLMMMVAVLGITTTSAQGVKFGVTAGLNVSTISGDIENAKYKAGFQAGVLADLGITENFSIIPELLFSQKGGKNEFEEEILGVEVAATSTITLNYLTIPVNAAYKFNLGQNQKFLIFAGPYVGYGLSTSVGVEVDGTSVETDAVKFGSGDEEIKALDFGVNVGVGYQFEKIFFKLQYNLGLSNLSNDKDYSMKNNNIAVSVGYLF
ncbi:MAG: PorT family protein [Dysgonamonadaceae bacterium]|jgi:opacity protein-like surface antigen|nr:PorT family protein [Dysgonamonadaceae bacterium]